MPNYSGIFTPSRPGVLPVDTTGMVLRQIGPTGTSPALMPNRPSQRQDYPVIDSVSGKAVSVLTRQPFTGVSPHTGQSFQNGELVTSQPGAIDPNNPQQRYSPVEIIKSPTIAGAASDLAGEFKTAGDAATASFDELLKQANNVGASSQAAFEREQATFDIGPYANRARGLVGDYATTMRGLVGRYGESDTDYERAARERVAQAYGLLPQYDTAAQAIADRQLQEAQKNVKRYKLSTGTPTSLGSDEIAMLNRAAADVLLPLEQSKIARRYDVLTGVDLPVERELATRRASRIAQFETPVERDIYSQAYDTERQIKALELQTAGMSRANTEAYLRSLNLPAQIMQEVLSRQIANLGGIAALEEASRYRGLQDLMGANITQPFYTGFQAPGYPVRSPASYPMAAPNAPSMVAPTTGTNGGVPLNPIEYRPLPRGASDQRFNVVSPYRYVEDGLGGYYDSVTGQYYQLGQPAIASQAGTVGQLPPGRYSAPGSYTIQDGVLTPVSRY